MASHSFPVAEIDMHATNKQTLRGVAREGEEREEKKEERKEERKEGEVRLSWIFFFSFVLTSCSGPFFADTSSGYYGVR